MSGVYFDILKDGFLTSAFFTVNNEFFLQTAILFDNNNKVFIYLAAIAGWVAGLLVNWISGYIIYRSVERILKKDETISFRYNKACSVFSRYISWLLIFSAFNYAVLTSNLPHTAPLRVIAEGDLSIFLFAILSVCLSMIAGFLKFNVGYFLALVTLSRSIYFVLLFYR